MQLQFLLLLILVFLVPIEKMRLSNLFQKLLKEKLNKLTTIDVFDCTTNIPALLSVPLLLLSSATERKTFVQAEAAPDCELKENEYQIKNKLRLR
jgi:hypothetical protein